MKPVVKIHTNKPKSTRRTAVNPVKTTAEWQRVFVDFSKILIVFIVAVSLLGFYTYINSQIQKTAKEITKLERDIQNVDREIENYNIAINELKSWKHINSQIARFDMQLQLPQAKQRFNITLLTKEQLHAPYADNNSEKSQQKMELTNKISMK